MIEERWRNKCKNKKNRFFSISFIFVLRHNLTLPMSTKPYQKRKYIFATLVVWLGTAFFPFAAPAQDLTELDEAARFLKNTGEDLKALTVYKLADTDGAEVVP